MVITTPRQQLGRGIFSGFNRVKVAKRELESKVVSELQKKWPIVITGMQQKARGEIKAATRQNDNL